MGDDEKPSLPALAVRTIVVTTRVAVRSHLNSDRPDLARESARRGLALLEDVARRIGAGGLGGRASDGGSDGASAGGTAGELDAAVRELRKLSSDGLEEDPG